MKKLLSILFILLPVIAYSQGFKGFYAEIKYDNFMGTDAEMFETDVQGLGSINSNYGFYRGYAIGSDAFELRMSGGLGLATKVYRFKNDYIFINQNDELLFQADDPAHEYDDGFFAYAKSKFYHYCLRFNPEIGFLLFDKILISGGPVIDMRLFIKQKNKYKIEDEFYSSELRRNEHFENELFNIGWKANLGFRRIGFTATYMTTPVFGGDNAPEINPVEFGVYFRTK